VRGFSGGTLGPRDANGDPLGGNRKMNMSLEALSALPGGDRSLRVLTFVDAGQVWGEGQPIRFSDVRASVGFGLAWISPIGPMKISYGVPVRTQPGDQLQRFQFQIGTGF
jgi:outer membrane protein insertion porin family